MGTIADYIDWRGDLSFEASPFNEVDNYILSKVGSANFRDIVPSSGGVPISTAVKLLQAAGRTELNTLASKMIMPAILRLPETARFSPLELWDYEAKLSADESEQFSGLTVVFPDGTNLVTFRGTDDTLIGWKEDLMMGVEESVAAQLDAQRYLTRVAEHREGPIIVAGHSKGGNLAVYAAATAPAEVQERILRVYNNDGPGFKDSFLAAPGYRKVREKIVTLIPQYSIVGTLLTQDRVTIVKSLQSGVPAHDGFNWEVCGPAFTRCERLSRGSKLFDNAMQDTMDTMSLEKTREFVDGVFDVLGATGADTIRDISQNKLRSAVNIVGALRQDTEVKHFVLRFLEESMAELRGLEEGMPDERKEAAKGPGKAPRKRKNRGESE